MTHTEDQYTPEQCFITTISGRKFYIDNPEWYVPDIAHALAMNCRFNGHCTDFYSVAEHSIAVAQLMDNLGIGDPLEGLMHDAAEAFVSDMPAPFKQKFRDLAKFERKLDSSLREYLHLPLEKTEECQRCDKMMMFIEAYHLTFHKGEEYADPWNLRPRALEFVNDFEPVGFLPRSGKLAFRQAYRKLALLKPNVPQLDDETSKNGLTTAV